jgi:citrate synthase
MLIKDEITVQIPSLRERISKLVTLNASVKITELNIKHLFGGMRGARTLVTHISDIDPVRGIILRGYTISEVLELLPKPVGAKFPLVGGLYYLLLVGKIPTFEKAMVVENEWKSRSKIPDYLFNVLRALPPEAHPMTLFSQAILALQPNSVFAKEYSNGLQRADYWQPTLEDGLNLTAKLPEIAAYIYNLKYRDGNHIPPDPNLDWGANFAHMIGKGDNEEYKDLSRLFFLLHCDQAVGNVSAHTAHLVNSALSDVYYSCSAGMNGLAGPLHGLANQECLYWLQSVQEKFNGLPTREQLENYTWETLKAGKVVPGYGHAVLRNTDPRFTAFIEFGNHFMPDDELFKLVKLVYEVVPDVLSKVEKIKDPWPNIDAISGSIQYHYGITQAPFYTVLFGVGRVLGLTSHAVWARLMGLPIERPKSVTIETIEEIVGSTSH